MSRVHKLMAKDSLNSPGILRRSDGTHTENQEESAQLLLDTHFPGNQAIATNEIAPRM